MMSAKMQLVYGVVVCCCILFAVNVFPVNAQENHDRVCPDLDTALKLWSNVDSWNGSMPDEDNDVVISEPILLDVETPSLGSVTIEQGGAIVFSSSVPLAKLTALNIIVRGRLQIGGPHCEFVGNAEIVLTERSEDPMKTPQFNQKVLGVDKGGLLHLFGKEKLSWTKLSTTVRKPLVARDSEYQILNLVDDVSSWEIGDRIVIAATDYNGNESETFEIAACPECTSKQIRIQGYVQYTHLGELIESVDTRAAVGLLTRNIKFRGKMDTSCYGNKCDVYNFDTFGAHIRVGVGFEDARIVGVEFTDVGQQTVLGSYPIHYHMCGEVGNKTNKPIVKSNSIWHSYSRCITIHGAFGVQVTDNVCYDIMGHAYFIEDGGEKRITFDGNLGISIKRATLIASDATHASVFFISSPLVDVRNNIAVGGEDIGFAYVFPREPIQLSKGLGFFQLDEASRTLILGFDNNIAHSNGRYGLYFDNKFDENRVIMDISNDYDPREDPLDPTSDSLPVYFTQFTAFKNKECNARIRGNELHVVNASLADSRIGLQLLSSFPGAKFLTDSVVWGVTGVKSVPKTDYESSSLNEIMKKPYPPASPKPKELGIIGFGFGDAPTYLQNVYFNGFPNEMSLSNGALGMSCLKENLPSPVSGACGITFGFKEEGNRFYEQCFDDLSVINDFDGTLTLLAGSAIVKQTPFLNTPKCTCSGFSGICACQNKYIRIDVEPKSEKYAVTRNDIPEVTAENPSTDVASFLLIPEKSYILHFLTSFPPQLSFTAVGLDSSAALLLGICVPSQASFTLNSTENGNFAAVPSFAALSEDKSGDKFYWDKEVGVLFVKIVNPNSRTTATKLECPNNVGGDGPCPSVTISTTGTYSGVVDCRQTAYPKYTQPKENQSRRRSASSKKLSAKVAFRRKLM